MTDGREPLWRSILRDLEERLERGDIGAQFPTDRELVEHYGVSRHTVREAVRHLRARGVVERERGRGSFVRDPGLVQSLGTLYSLFRAVEATGMTQHSDVLALDRRTDAAAAARFGLRADAPLVHLERLRWAGDDPLALDTVWLPGDVGDVLLDVDFGHTALYDELERRAGITLTGGREAITAVAPDPDLAAVLDLEPHEGVLRIDRVGAVGDRTVECRVTLVRGSRFTLVSTWPGTAGVAPRVDADGR